jgi:hypothetical protein
MLNVDQIQIKWTPDMPIYASEHFLRAVSDEFGWLGGIDNIGNLICILPYSIIKKGFIRFCRFRLETMVRHEDFSIEQEKYFLKSSINWLKNKKIDVILPPSTNAIFRCFPEGAIAAPYSTWILDLQQDIDQIWHNISIKYRKDIKRATEKGLEIKEGPDQIDIAYRLIKNTFNRSKLYFMDYNSFKKINLGLGANAKILVAYYNNIPQSCTSYHFSKYCAYAVHGGSSPEALPGAMKFLQWEAIKLFKAEGVKYFDFLGARVNPNPKSKQEGILLFKKYFGASPRYGFIWKYPINKIKYAFYQVGIKCLMGGDIVDQEKSKLDQFLNYFKGFIK